MKVSGAILGVLAAALVLGSAGGAATGDNFVLGRSNSAGDQTILTANLGSAVLRVNNTGTAAALRGDAQSGTGLNGTSVSGTGEQGQSQAGIGVFGQHTNATGANPGVQGTTSSTDPNGAGVAGRNTGGGPGLKAVVNAGVPPLAVNSDAKVTNLNVDKLDSLDSAAFWKLGGNGGTAPGTDFLGTTDNQALELKVNGARALRIEPRAKSPNLIGGFFDNVVQASADGATIAGGGHTLALNLVSDDFGTVGGGAGNRTGDQDGFQDPETAPYATVGGGFGNAAAGANSTVSGGTGNNANGDEATVGGGNANTAGIGGTVAGGFQDSAGGGSFVGGGAGNSAQGGHSAVAGGQGNEALGSNSAVAGGVENAALGGSSFAAGNRNTAGGDASVVAGGGSNTASGIAGAVGGGIQNSAGGTDSTVPGGFQNNAGGDRSFAAGTQAKATRDGSFVWGDRTFTDLASPAANTFTIRATGGIWLGTTSSPSIPAGRFINTSTGGYLSSAGAWTNASDRALKRDFRAVDRQALLRRLARTPVQSWRYKAEGPHVRHIGPTAQDFFRDFGLGLDDKHIATIDEDGVALAAIQGLYRQNQALRSRVAKLERAVVKLSRSRR